MTIKAQRAKVIMEADVETQQNDGDNSLDSERELSASDISEPDYDNIDDDGIELLNEGWADSIAKILKTNKPKKKKTLVLSKAKKLTDPIKKVRTEKYEIATADGQVKKEQTVVEQKIDQDGPPKKKRRELPNLRIKPNILEKDRERILQKIATKGVVQLFNAVKMQQKDISKKLEEAGPLEVRKEKVLKNIDKRAFLDVLMGEKSSTLRDELQKSNDTIERSHTSNSNKNSNRNEATWNILRDDFMMSAKLKDWDKELENEDSEKEMEIDEEVESD